MNEILWIGLALVVIVAGVLARRGERNRRGLSDDLVRQIEAVGRIDRDDIDPLYVDDIRSEEDEFWAQSWDEPESLGDDSGWDRSGDPWS